MPQTCDASFSSEITNHLFPKAAKRFDSALLFKSLSLEKKLKIVNYASIRNLLSDATFLDII